MVSSESYFERSVDYHFASETNSQLSIQVALELVSGFNLALKPGQKIVQAWRATGWWPDHYSVATFDIAKTRGGTKLKFTQIGIPPNRYSGHYRGWIETYWTPMKEIFATGQISQRTKDRVKIDREQRIKTGRFRRSISKEA